VRVVFFGTPAVAATSLAALLEAGVDVPLVVTQPDRPIGRSKRPMPSAVKQLALDHQLPVEQPQRLRTKAFRESIGALEPDLLAVVAYGRILSQRLIDQTPLGAVNVHFSLLPAYRGAAPVQWALANGEQVTGVTTMHINARLDEGDLLLQEPLEIAAGEHAPALTQRLAERGAPLLVRTLQELKAGALRPVPQAHELASFAPILLREHGFVDPLQMSAAEIEGRVRGFDPWPGVWLMHAGQRLRLHVARAIDQEGDAEAGQLVHLADDRWALRCARETWLQIDEVQLQGRRRLPIADVIRGRQLQDGARLEAICER